MTIWHFNTTSYTCPCSLTELLLPGRVFLQPHFPLAIETSGMQWPWARAPSQTHCSPRPIIPGAFCMFPSQGCVLVAVCEHLSQALEPGLCSLLHSSLNQIHILSIATYKQVHPQAPDRKDESPKTELSVKWWKVLLMEKPSWETKDNKRTSNSTMILQLLQLLCGEVYLKCYYLVWREMGSPSVRDNSLKKSLRQVCYLFHQDFPSDEFLTVNAAEQLFKDLQSLIPL